MKKTVLTILLVVALAVLPVFGTALAAQKTLVIGGIAFLTGPAAAGGMACKTGWELAVARYNDAGGMKIGKDMYKIKLIVEDDAMSLDQASTAATKLIQRDGAKFIVGPLVDAFKNAIYPITSQANVLLASVDTCNASRAITYEGNTDVSKDRPLYIRGHWANDEIIPHLLDYLKAHYPKAKKVAVCGVTEACTVGLYNWLKDTLAARGLERVGALEQIAPDCADYNPPVTRLLSAKPDAIVVAAGTPTTWGFTLKAARELGFKGPIFCATHLDVEFTNMIAGGGNTDIFGAGITLTDMDPLSKEMKNARKAYASHGYPAKDEISDVYLVGYNGLWVLLQTIEKAQSFDAATVVKTYEGLTKKGDLQTLWGNSSDGGGAYVGGLKETGVNRVLCEPYWIDACMNGVSKNVKNIFIAAP
jgi:ABC-type branched-subunit amino acid transport system substrate-binding protein